MVLTQSVVLCLCEELPISSSIITVIVTFDGISSHSIHICTIVGVNINKLAVVSVGDRVSTIYTCNSSNGVRTDTFSMLNICWIHIRIHPTIITISELVVHSHQRIRPISECHLNRQSVVIDHGTCAPRGATTQELLSQRVVEIIHSIINNRLSVHAYRAAPKCERRKKKL